MEPDRMKHRIFGVNPGETEAAGVLRICKIMQRVLEFWNPEISDNNMINYSLVRNCKEKFDEIDPALLMKYILKHEEVSEVYKTVNAMAETPRYKVVMAMVDGQMLF